MFPHGIMLHHFHQCGNRHAQGSLTAENFLRLLEFIGTKNILSAQEWLERSLSNRLEPNHRCITFDDNLKSQYDIALPVLESYGLTAYFFIYSSVCEGGIENLEVYRFFRYFYHDTINDFYHAFEQAAEELYPQWHVKQQLEAFNADEYLKAYTYYTIQDKRFRYLRDQIIEAEYYEALMDEMIKRRGLNKKALAENLWVNNKQLQALQTQGNIIGLHSYTHPTRIDQMSIKAQQQEYQLNNQHLSTLLGSAPSTMSHPCGVYTKETLELLRSMNVTLGFRADMAMGAAPSALEYPRRDHSDIIRQMENQP